MLLLIMSSRLKPFGRERGMRMETKGSLRDSTMRARSLVFTHLLEEGTHQKRPRSDDDTSFFSFLQSPSRRMRTLSCRVAEEARNLGPRRPRRCHTLFSRSSRFLKQHATRTWRFSNDPRPLGIKRPRGFQFQHRSPFKPSQRVRVSSGLELDSLPPSPAFNSLSLCLFILVADTQSCLSTTTPTSSDLARNNGRQQTHPQQTCPFLARAGSSTSSSGRRPSAEGELASFLPFHTNSPLTRLIRHSTGTPAVHHIHPLCVLPHQHRQTYLPG